MGSNAAGQTPTGITFVIVATDALLTSHTVTITASPNIWASVPACTWNGNAATEALTGNNQVAVTAQAAANAGDPITIVCTGGFNANGNSASTVTFSAVSSTSTVSLTGQTGYSTTGRLTWGAATTVSTLAVGTAPTSIVFSIGVSDALVDGDTITITATNSVFVASSMLSCVAPGVGMSTATTPTATTLVIQAPANGVSSGSKTFTCTGTMAANLAIGTSTTFTAVSTKSTTTSVADGGYTTVAGRSLGWTSATLAGSNAAGQTPSGITFVIVATDALLTSHTVTITASPNIWASVPACTWNGNAATEALTGNNQVAVTAQAAANAGDPITIVCTGGFNANGNSASTVTFSAVSSTSTVSLTGQTGYSTTGRLTWGAATAVSTLVTGHVPSSIVFSIGVSDALVDGDTITITATNNVFVASSTLSCIAPGVGLSSVTAPTATTL